MPSKNKDKLLEVAQTLVQEKGYQGFSFHDLSAAVGITTASIHYHFPKKEDLALALMARYRENVLEAFDEIAVKKAKAGDQLKAVIKIYREALGGCDMLCLCVAFSSGPDSLNPDILSEIHKFQNGARDRLATMFALGAKDGSIEAVGKPADEAAACLALLQGAQLVARAAGDLKSFDLAANVLKARI